MERERLVKEEHDRIHQGMMKLIEERDKKLAERGIFTIEQEIAEIEQRNQELRTGDPANLVNGEPCNGRPVKPAERRT